MTSHIAVLPQEVLEVLRVSLPNSDESHNTHSRSFLRLPHPRTGLTALFFGVNEKIVEAQAVVPPNNRSWFIGDEVVGDGKLTIMTPIDPVFLLIPLLQAIQPADGSAASFRQAEDLFETAGTKIHDPSLSEDIVRLASLSCIQHALRCICETKDITAEIVVYRFSLEQTLAYLRTKVERLASPSVLEISRATMRQLSKDGLDAGAGEEIMNAGRRKAACDLVGQYLAPELRDQLLASFDFSDLDSHVRNIRLMDPEIPVAPEKPKDSKKRKAKEDENAKPTDKKKKSNKDSHGVEKLKKANINGMAKLSSFFKKS